MTHTINRKVKKEYELGLNQRRPSMYEYIWNGCARLELIILTGYQLNVSTYSLNEMFNESEATNNSSEQRQRAAVDYYGQPFVVVRASSRYL